MSVQDKICSDIFQNDRILQLVYITYKTLLATLSTNMSKFPHPKIIIVYNSWKFLRDNFFDDYQIFANKFLRYKLFHQYYLDITNDSRFIFSMMGQNL